MNDESAELIEETPEPEPEVELEPDPEPEPDPEEGLRQAGFQKIRGAWRR